MISEESPARRKVWLLYPDPIRRALTGPPIRILEIAAAARQAGLEVHLCTPSCEISLPDATWHPLEFGLLEKIRLGDAVLASSELPAKFAWHLCRSPIPFHLDAYNVSSIEVLEIGSMSPSTRMSELAHRLRKSKVLWQRCEHGYLSTRTQAAFLGGAFHQSYGPSGSELARTLPSKSSLAPMGVSLKPIVDVENPYPDALRNRPILLWGGGVWPWFDVETLLEGFDILADQGSPAALWFLSGSGTNGATVLDSAANRAIELARKRGLLGTSVFFGESDVSADRLPSFLVHCVAGVMSNPSSLEAVCSWRTRLLDLVGTSRPLFSIGHDPLSDLMATSGAAVVTPSGNPTAFAAKVSEVLSDRRVLEEMGRKSGALAETLSWSRVIAPIVDHLLDPLSFQRLGPRPGLIEAVLFALAR